MPMIEERAEPFMIQRIASLNRVQLRFADYQEKYELLLREEQEFSDMSEYQFNLIEIEVMDDFLHYKSYLDEGPNGIEDRKVKNFIDTYHFCLDSLKDEILQNGTNIVNSVKRKIDFVKTRQVELFKNGYVTDFETTKIVVQQTFEPISLTDKININVIPTYFYELLKDNKINSSKANLIRLLAFILRDKNGSPLSENTLKDIFNDSKPEARFKN